ncbi:MAG TPA: CdaR family protein [Candidatus Dormibacteraeota bacterium]|nr:CdaR family protein [Candidatus Dormibacteraeota bacterium]
MSWSLITNQWRLKLLAFGLAVLMLGAVAFSQNPPTTKAVTVPLSYSVPPNIVLINPPFKVILTVRGLADSIARADATNLVASVDANRALPGTAVSLNIDARSLDNHIQVEPHDPIAVQVDTRQVREVPVQVNVRPAPGFQVTKVVGTCPASSTPNPCKVHFDGPVTWETNLTASVAYPGTVTAGSIHSPNQLVTLSNSTGVIDLTSCRTQPCAQLDTNSVNLDIETVGGVSSNTVPLVDSPPAQPPPQGYRVTAISVTPITVVISGEPAVLSRIQRLTLPPVDLSRSTSDVTFTVAIPYPDGVTGSPANATIKYSISANPNAPPGP